MFSLSPTITASDAAGVNALIALITNADAAKARLADLQAAVEEANAKATEAKALAAQAAADRAEVERAAEVADQKNEMAIEQAKAERRAAEKALAEVDAKIARAERGLSALAEQEAAFNDNMRTAEAVLSSREAAVADREDDVAAREAAIGEREAKANAIVAEYERKLTALKRIAE